MFGIKKLIGLSLILFPLSLISGCGEESASEEKINLGMISYLNASESKMTEMLNDLEAKRGEKISPYQTIYYDNLNTMLMDLDSGRLNEISTYKSVAYYIMGRNNEIEPAPLALKLSDSFCCAFRQEDTELLASVDNAIEEMKSDGTLLRLTKKYITEIKGDKEPEPEDLPEFSGADTIKIAVTGDLPPLDLILADGRPAGFNTAVIAEIGRRIKKNFVLVSIESGARAQALTSGVVDMLFWARVPDEKDGRSADIDKSAGINFAIPYFSDEIVHVQEQNQP